ncbi:biotin-independent malonate decarboxylase subunit gamma [Ramlibacter albus]|uniref:Biotin-independent malonate decarboxylase subunit gamma n=1 Tax=Ramlibacter albus TaxID=2079448 RepID=A0A923MBQ3_9BURK|nr:biotin-independent malonate decarboxylase subunit gamma [Ramlibacter albus]MBC5766394.1 biotin-independent malonate decarboxylase subunit gamma [Ramlibacter albus]
MNWNDLATRLFGDRHDIREERDLLRGTATFDGATLCVLGTTNHAAIGYELALRQAAVVLGTIEDHPGRPILLLVDTQGQQLRRADEFLGINRAMAHLGCCIDLARRRGHAVIGVVYDQALSGGFITTGLLADECHALPEAEIRVMRLPAMARITKIPEATLAQLSQANPVFAPGVENYVAMGAVRSLWNPDDPASGLRTALAARNTRDVRAADGEQRGGRTAARPTVQKVLDAA